MPRTFSVRSGAPSINVRAEAASVTLAGMAITGYAGPVICIGASTGGTEAVKAVLQGFAANTPPVLIVQHMPEMFTAAFAKRLDAMCAMRVKEAEDGERLARGMAYVAPGHSHLAVVRSGAVYQCRLSKDGPVNRHRPAVDVLFRSAARVLGASAVGVLLTGMGKDGADGLLEMRRSGAWTIAQDQASCVVYGMPREAVAIGAACEVLPLDRIAAHVCRRLGIDFSGLLR